MLIIPGFVLKYSRSRMWCLHFATAFDISQRLNARCKQRVRVSTAVAKVYQMYICHKCRGLAKLGRANKIRIVAVKANTLTVRVRAFLRF